MDNDVRWLEQAAIDAQDTTHRLYTEASAMLNRWAQDNLDRPSERPEPPGPDGRDWFVPKQAS